MNFFRSKFFIFCLIAAILLALVPTVIAAFGGTDMLRSALGTVAKPFTMCASGIANAFNGFVDVFTEYDELKAENEKLKEQIKEYEDREYNEELLKEQNEWLKSYINIHNANPSLQFADARVIAREAGNYSTVITFNKGSAHGIQKNMPVITENGLIGQVSELGLDWCKVVTIIEPTSSIGVIIEKNGKLGIVEGSGELYSEGLCRMSYIGDSSGIEMGDRVYTSGVSGSKYPGGLYIGSIVDTYLDENTGELIAVVKPGVDFTDLESITDALIVCGIEG